MDKRVSILTPCYNGEKYIDRYVKSLLDQEYDNCQLVFMDDGSTDATKEKIIGYENELREKGIDLEYYYHDNAGLGATISEGIHYVNGDYLIWPDIDDVMPRDSIRLKVKFLEDNMQYGLVRTNFLISQDEPSNVINSSGTSVYKNKTKTDLFDDYLISQNMWLQPGCYMVRMQDFDKANPDRYIYPTRTGQDWQMLLPILYYFKCGYIDTPLYNYILRSDSMSRTASASLEKEDNQFAKYEELIIATVKHMEISGIEEYIKKVHTHYIQERITLGYKYSDSAFAKKYWNLLDKKDRSLKLWLKKSFADSRLLKRLISFARQN